MKTLLAVVDFVSITFWMVVAFGLAILEEVFVHPWRASCRLGSFCLDLLETVIKSCTELGLLYFGVLLVVTAGATFEFGSKSPMWAMWKFYFLVGVINVFVVPATLYLWSCHGLCYRRFRPFLYRYRSQLLWAMIGSIVWPISWAVSDFILCGSHTRWGNEVWKAARYWSNWSLLYPRTLIQARNELRN